ncbi:hypothetical protein B0H13DRAFT_1884645 [Mycena leptocephala]|nr:hypothetical protein B0H13DRAFT_1884645 [Mycena leptocephala]
MTIKADTDLYVPIGQQNIIAAQTAAVSTPGHSYGHGGVDKALQHRLPLELERTIFEIAALPLRSIIPVLMRIAWRVKHCLPIIRRLPQAVRLATRDQPSLATLSAPGIKVHDFFYESILPPIAPFRPTPCPVRQQTRPRPLQRTTPTLRILGMGSSRAFPVYSRCSGERGGVLLNLEDEAALHAAVRRSLPRTGPCNGATIAWWKAGMAAEAKETRDALPICRLSEDLNPSENPPQKKMIRAPSYLGEAASLV